MCVRLRVPRWVWLALPICAALAIPGAARAGNGLHPRTPVVWNDTACMEVVDRSVDSVYMLEYDIPFEDTEVTPDEVPDSRTHQFVATCRQTSPQDYLPGWITQADVDVAVTFDLINEDSVPPDEIFEVSEAWAGCWHRINGDDERRPITYEMADQPVPWETAGLPIGTYYLWGFTHEPAFNLWTPRKGAVIKIIDGGDPADIGPGGAVTTPEQTACVGEPVPIEGCVDALPGSTLTASYAITSEEGSNSPDWEPTWRPIAQDLAIEDESFVIDWIAPEEAGGEQVMIRVVFTDPMDRSYTAYQADLDVILPAGSPGCQPDPGSCESGFIMDPSCETSTGGATSGDDTATGSDGTDTAPATTGPTSTTTDASTTPGQDDDGGDPKGCACTTTSRTGLTPPPLLLLLPTLLLRRRRALPTHR